MTSATNPADNNGGNLDAQIVLYDRATNTFFHPSDAAHLDAEHQRGVRRPAVDQRRSASGWCSRASSTSPTTSAPTASPRFSSTTGPPTRRGRLGDGGEAQIDGDGNRIVYATNNVGEAI